MAKRITQETFDSVVKENVEDFEMEPAEAVEDATKQFEAQGVDLSNIVKDLSLDDHGSSHAVLEAVEFLKSSINPLQGDSVLTILPTFISECNIDLAHRCLAGNNQGFQILFEGLQASSADEELTKNFLEALCALLNGQPDIISDAGIEYFANLLKSETRTDLLELILRVIRFTCIMHERNRQAFVSQDIITLLTSCLQKYKSCPGVVKESCSMLKVLTNDDDVRVPFGKAHEHARMIVTEAEALKTIMNISQEYTGSKAVLGELFSTLGRLAVRNEFCQEIMDLGGLDMMMKSLASCIDDVAITSKIMGVLKTIAGNDNVKVAIIQAGGAQLILATMAKHQAQPQHCENGCAALAAVALRNPANCAKIMAAGGAAGILRCMEVHKNSNGVQKQACMAVRNIVGRSRDYIEPFIELGAENLINSARAKFADCDDEAKAALRDLECKVELRELWKGEHADLER